MGRRTLLLIASILVAALGTALIWLYVQGADTRAVSSENQVPVYVAAAPLTAGQQVTSQIAQIKQFPQSLVAGLGGSLVTSTAQIHGYAKTDIAPGLPLLTSQFTGQPGDAGAGGQPGSRRGRDAGHAARPAAARRAPSARVAHPRLRSPVKEESGPGVGILFQNVRVLGVGPATGTTSAAGTRPRHHRRRQDRRPAGHRHPRPQGQAAEGPRAGQGAGGGTLWFGLLPTDKAGDDNGPSSPRSPMEDCDMTTVCDFDRVVAERARERRRRGLGRHEPGDPAPSSRGEPGRGHRRPRADRRPDGGVPARRGDADHAAEPGDHPRPATRRQQPARRGAAVGVARGRRRARHLQAARRRPPQPDGSPPRCASRAGGGARPAGRPRGRIVTVFSAKGGCGKTTLATNMAAVLADRGRREVALVDLDLAFGDVAIALQLFPAHTIADAVPLGDNLDFGALQSLLTPHSPGLTTLVAPVEPGTAEAIPARLVVADPRGAARPLRLRHRRHPAGVRRPRADGVRPLRRRRAASPRSTSRR